LICGLSYRVLMPAPMGRARLVLREKVIDEEGNITEVAIWAVPGRRSGQSVFDIG